MLWSSLKIALLTVRRIPQVGAAAVVACCLLGVSRAEVHPDCFDKQWGVTCAKERAEDAQAADAALAGVAARQGWQQACYQLQYVGGQNGEAYMILISMMGKKGGTAPDCLDPVSTTRGVASVGQMEKLAADMKKALLRLPPAGKAKVLRQVDSLALVNGRGGQVELQIP